MTNLYKKFSLAMMLSGALVMTACTTETVSNPPRTATEELLISSAADHAADQLLLKLPRDSKVFLDNSNFEGTDSKYAVGAIRSILMKQGFHLIDAKKDADIVVEVRSGALSIDNKELLIGTPKFGIPIPFAVSEFTIPEIAFYKSVDQKGVAKFATTTYDAKTGALIEAGDPKYGFSHNTGYTVMIIVSWQDNNALPKDKDEDRLSPTLDNVSGGDDKATSDSDNKSPPAPAAPASTSPAPITPSPVSAPPASGEKSP